uniref:Uncharacterized protein n=2 Tax=Picea TaxID=3328 RepID=A0A117NHP0_PICGL|nr:hypothetical protein ABT39_MTgene4683 [Picea glauca]QHR92689.1 hypothetical protein Q903MT_gene6737 [Picea sitchensis]
MLMDQGIDPTTRTTVIRYALTLQEFLMFRHHIHLSLLRHYASFVSNQANHHLACELPQPHHLFLIDKPLISSVQKPATSTSFTYTKRKEIQIMA